MNKKFNDIAENYQIASETSERILQGMGIENVNKNPSKDKLEAFASICESIKNGTSYEEAIANCLRDREGDLSVLKENTFNSENITQASQQIGKETGKQMARIIPPLQQQGCNEVVNGFNRGLVEGFQEGLGEINFTEIFEEFSTTDIEDIRQGKLKSGLSSVALPQGNSESSPEESS